MSLPRSHRLISTVIHFFGVSILTHCISRRTAVEDLRTCRGWRRLFCSAPRLLILSALICAWAQLVIGGIFVHGIGLDGDLYACASAITACFVCYCAAQVCMFVFFIEKVHIVWKPLQRTTRWRSPVYVCCGTSVLGYIALCVVAVIRRMSRLNYDGTCEIAVHTSMIIPILAVVTYMNMLFTFLFVWSLTRHTFSGSPLRGVAWRALIAAFVGLSSSTVNAVVLTVYRSEMGWICIGSCSADLIVNCLAVFWASNKPSQHSSAEIEGSLYQRRKGSLSIITFNHHQSSKPLSTFPTGDHVAKDCAKDHADHIQPPAPTLSSRTGLGGMSSTCVGSQPSLIGGDQTAPVFVRETGRPARWSWS